MIATIRARIVHRPDLAGRPAPEMARAAAPDPAIAAGGSQPTVFAVPPVSLWVELHERALTVTDDDLPWLVQFEGWLPCGPCRADWARMLRQTPPTFGDRYFAWTVDRHNEINRMLGKPLMTLRAALDRWVGRSAAANRAKRADLPGVR